mmetsp:Transcript_1096/g.1595  ORF Transcript_1096/g.1595 Transcript_1096/m.1595 type:complete len:428 (-) Transcript_1096:54-1337(-)
MATSCFDGCSPAPNALPSNRTHWTEALESTRGTFTLVIAWCCEPLNWIHEREQLFAGLLKHVVIVEKCVMGKKWGWVANKTRLADRQCNPQRAIQEAGLHLVTSFSSTIQKRELLKQQNKIEARVHTQRRNNFLSSRLLLNQEEQIDAEIVLEQEPGRNMCTSSDECGAYLHYIIDEYETLGDGIIFVQGDGGIPHRVKFPPAGFVQFAKLNGVLPMVYTPLTVNWGAGGNPSKCLHALTLPEATPFNPPLQKFHKIIPGDLVPTGARNGVFFVSRHVLWRRPQSWYRELRLFLEVGMVCKAASCYETSSPITEINLDSATINSRLRLYFENKIASDPDFRHYFFPTQNTSNVQQRQVRDDRSYHHLLCNRSQWSMACVLGCSFLEHAWHAVACESCRPTRSTPKNPDIRIPTSTGHTHPPFPPSLS